MSERLFSAAHLGSLKILLPAGAGLSSPEASIQQARVGAISRVATGVPVTLAAGETVTPQVLNAEDVDFSIDAAQFVISNAAGTQKLAVGWTTDEDVESGTATTTLNFASATQVAKTGSDLSFENDGSGGTRIKSTAGGEFFAVLQVKVDEFGD